jgi:gamma-glutamyltranspeptidase/glutathione hydrolase
MRENLYIGTLLALITLTLAADGLTQRRRGNRPRPTAQEQMRALEQQQRQLDEQGIAINPYVAGRSMTLSRKGIVATSHTLASQAGLDMLRSGGSAMDAAVAAAATLAVVEPQSTGIGGDVWILYFDAATKKVHALNGSGRSPMALTREHFGDRRGMGGGWEVVTVPGAVDAYATAVERFGKKPLADVLEPAIRYASEGFAVTEKISRAWRGSQGKLSRDKWASETFLPEGRAPEIGELFANPNLARSLRLIAEGGRDAYYEGPIAEEIVRYAQESGGFLTMADFAEHHSDWVEPITTNFMGYDVYQCPPNGQGMAVLMMLNIMEGFDLASMKHNSPEYLHLLIEAKKLAYADLGRYNADPETADIPLDGLLSKEYAAQRRALIDPERAAPTVEPGVPLGHDTIYLCAIDEEGNAASFINSLYSGFGSGIVGGNTGITLQNRGSGFVLERGHFNEYAPGKRPFHTIIPGMVLRDGELYMAYGLMGGAMQPQGHTQMLLSHLVFGMNIQEANDVLRWRHSSGLRVSLEQGTPMATLQALVGMGHQVSLGGGSNYGGAQVILVDPVTGTYFGASDPRKDGAAVGW